MHTASHPVPAGIGSSPSALLNWISRRKWMAAWIDGTSHRNTWIAEHSDDAIHQFISDAAVLTLLIYPLKLYVPLCNVPLEGTLQSFQAGTESPYHESDSMSLLCLKCPEHLISEDAQSIKALKSSSFKCWGAGVPVWALLNYWALQPCYQWSTKPPFSANVLHLHP